jgi:hypothetical protein
MWEVCHKARTGNRPSECQGFCAHLKLKDVAKGRADNAPVEVEFLMSTICMVFLSGHTQGVPRERQVRVVKGTKAPIISEGFVGVCCKSMQKLCHDVKLSWVERHRIRTKQ